MNNRAQALFNERIGYSENAFAQIVVWHVPRPLLGSTHHYKYRLAYVVDDRCVLRYDNEAGKGDHCHYNDTEAKYGFVDLATLLSDFSSDITRWNHENRLV
jgi:hypothetical protein